MNIQLLNHQIQVDFINGYEYLDNIGKILALIANERNNINFNLNSNNNNEVTIGSPTNTIDNISINPYLIKLFANNGDITDNLQYIISHVQKIAKIININKIGKITIKPQFKVDIDNLKDKIFTNNNITYFNLVMSDMIRGQTKITPKLFVGTQQITTPQYLGTNLNLKVENKIDEKLFILELDISSFDLNGIEVKGISSKINTIYSSILEILEEFAMEVINSFKHM
jgi:hypothetical protein